MPDTHPEVRAYVADVHIEKLADMHLAALLEDRDALAGERDAMVRDANYGAWLQEHARADAAVAALTEAEQTIEYLNRMMQRMVPQDTHETAMSKLTQIAARLYVDETCVEKLHAIDLILKGTSA